MPRHSLPCAIPLVAVTISILAACGHSSPAAAGADGEVAVAVTKQGFEPRSITAQVGHPVTLVVTRKVEHTCATEIVIKDFGIDQPLPLDQPVKVAFTPTRPGTIRFACAMDMIAGEVVVQ